MCIPRHIRRMSEQDWTPVVIRKARSSAVSSPIRQTAESAQIRKLEQNDIVKVKQLSKESRQEIVSRRALLKMTQTQLNQACLFPPNTINKIESGQLSPTISQLNALNRFLKTGLKYEQT